jgi:hypothetical protein
MVGVIVLLALCLYSYIYGKHERQIIRRDNTGLTARLLEKPHSFEKIVHGD